MKNENQERSRRKLRRGIVTSDRMNKSIVVEVIRKYRHPLYKKVVRKSNSYHVHDENNKARVDDFVEIMETRPISKTKRWRLVRIIKSANEVS